MDLDIYNTIKDKGLRLSSPSLGVITETTNELNRAMAAVNRLPVLIPPALVGVPESLVTKMTDSLTDALATTTQSTLSIQESLNNVFSSITQSSLVNNLESVDGCANLTELTGSVTGEIDDFLHEMKSIAAAQIQHIEDYLANVIDEGELGAFLDALIAKFEPLKNSITSIFDKEKALFSDMKNKLASASQANMISELWNNPCSKMLLEQTLPDDLKELLP
ncbi:hypothetical protein PVK63_06400 [Aliivibrio sp. S2TY2]|uniref:DUF7217 family protein n=1 Tax=unclassified Aliivibrio TaxID=2645654 RepID=UPI0023791F0E|nr:MULTISPECIES: hypothetical protein [unclassified Aliivibrio]MDD9174501.1 hypothetical protein [Aliivibrio sp. S3TY1]MDD9191579.1 hypothetical protein [Aliivibrio sp. S2TY2]